MTNEDYDTVSFAMVLCRTNAPQGGQKMRGEFQGQHAKLKSNNFPAIDFFLQLPFLYLGEGARWTDKYKLKKRLFWNPYVALL